MSMRYTATNAGGVWGRAGTLPAICIACKLVHGLARRTCIVDPQGRLRSIMPRLHPDLILQYILTAV